MPSDMSPAASESLVSWIPSKHEELALADLVRYPHLDAIHGLWSRASSDGCLPAKLSPHDLPRAALPNVMLLDLEEAGGQPLLRIRLAGTYVCDIYGGELKGRTTGEFFQPKDARLVVDAALAVAESRTPSLARRSYVSLNDTYWRYVRLILPLSRDGERVDSFFKVAAPESMTDLGTTGLRPA